VNLFFLSRTRTTTSSPLIPYTWHKGNQLVCSLCACLFFVCCCTCVRKEKQLPAFACRLKVAAAFSSSSFGLIFTESMDAPTSPAKRRVLGELNPNAASPKACRRTDLKLAGASPTKQQLPRSPIKMKLAPPTIEQQNASPSRKLRQPQKQHMEAEESPKKRRSPSPVSQQAVTESSRQDAERDEVVEPPTKRPCLQQSAEGQQGAQESVKVHLSSRMPINS